MTAGWTQAHLDRVSRSFAFCIAQLPEPLRQWTGLSYLMCRVLDTIEDAPWADRRARQQAYLAFDALVGRRPNSAEVQAWAALLPGNLPAAELTLLADAQRLFTDLAALPANAAEPIVQTVREMSAGMRHYSQAQLADGALRLDGLGEVNRYCYFVAGTVGRLLTRLFVAYRPSFLPGPGLLKDGLHFGLFLQKVNLLKDQGGDEQEDRFLVPDRQAVLASACDNAAGAMAYLAALPLDELGYRRFCAWSLFLGTASLAAVCASWQGQGPGKLTRPQTAALLGEVEAIITDNAKLQQLMRGHLAQLPVAPAAAALTPTKATSTPTPLTWFTELAGRFAAPPLRGAELAELQLV